jgi:Helicase conserved C-terminal domain
MSWYGTWGRGNTREIGAFHERAYGREGLAEWDVKWHGLTPQARSAFVNTVKGPARNQADHAPTYSVPRDKFGPHVLEELTAAGFVGVLPARSKTSTDRVFAPARLYDFAARVRMLNRHHLLGGDRPVELGKYVEQAFYVHDLLNVMRDVLRKAGMDEYVRLDEALQRYVRNYRWPAWVSRVLRDPLADRILKAVQEAGGPVPLVELPDRVAGADPDKVRPAVGKLIARLVLFEDLDPQTSEIVVDFLPAVREGLARAGRPRVRPPLVVCERPREVGPDDSPIVSDLRAFLLEVAAEPPRLRQDRHLFQKEVERFQAGLEPLPAWLMKMLGWSDERRLNQALAWARTLGLVEDVADGAQDRLRLTSKGQQWLASGLDAQYAGVYGLVNAVPSRSGGYTPQWRLFAIGPDSYYSGFLDDVRFLGEDIMVLRGEKERKYIPDYWEAKPEDIRALRAALDRALAALDLGVFYWLDSVVAHLAYGEHNPLNLGLAPDAVAVVRGQRLIPPLEELREEAGRSLIEAFVTRRLIPLGCVRTAIDADGKVCIARERRLDAYFGRAVAASDLAPAADTAARVVVQPDFSVIVIGPNPTAAAELAPFCERAAGGGTRGAVILKITRESVVRAVAHGLEPAEIADRLRRHASHEVPANVLHEVREWSNWVRRVTPATLAVLRCPDRDTADRVMGALKRQAERLNETVVAVGQKLTAAERNKLRTQGIIIEGHGEAPASKPKARKKGRAW